MTQAQFCHEIGVNGASFHRFYRGKYKNPWKAVHNGTYWGAARFFAREKIKKAIEFADSAHQGQYRKSGEPFLMHPINVGLILASLKMDADTIIAGLLHDVVEDCEIPISKVKKEFGKNVSVLVNGVTKLLQLDEKIKGDSQADNFQKMAHILHKNLIYIFFFYNSYIMWKKLIFLDLICFF